jgi:hypothetical protein
LKKHLWLWGILLVTLLLSTPAIYERWSSEWNNNAYEIIVPQSEIDYIVNSSLEEMSVEPNEVYKKLKNAGVDSISIEPETIASLEEQNKISLLSMETVEENLFFSDEENVLEELDDKEGVFLSIPPDSTYLTKIEEHFADMKEIEVKGKSLYFIPGIEGVIDYAPLGYNSETITQIKQNGFQVVLRMENLDPEENQTIIEEAIRLQDESTNKILFSGQEVVGFPETQKIKSFMQQLNGAGYSFFTIEFSGQDGFQTLARTTDYDVMRLHSLNLNNSSSMEENIDRSIRAVKERNIRALFFRFEEIPGEESLTNATTFITEVENNMPSTYASGTATAFQKIEIPTWVTLMALISGVLFVTIAALTVFNKRLSIVAGIFMLLLALAYLFTDKLLIVQAFSLIIAIVTPIFAVIYKGKTETFKDVILGYLRAIGISIIGIFVIVALLNGNEFLIKSEVFKGVKLVYIIPIAFITLYAFYGLIIDILKSNMKYWHALLLVIVGAAGFYYISRTGNAGSVSDIELLVRQKLEELMYVRPRTKEFLIGFPFYVLALYTLKINRRLSLFIMIPGVIGFLSMVNTFTHLHIPLSISILRSAYSLALGFIIGVIFIYLFKLAYKYYLKIDKTRWQ